MNNDTPADAITALQNLSSFVGAGGLDVTDVTSLDERIRWGIDVQVSVAIQRAAQIVEDCSKVPSTKWGQVKAAILGLDTCKHPYTRTTSLAAQDGLVEALRPIVEWLENQEYNPFEPDNQSATFHKIMELSALLGPDPRIAALVSIEVKS